MSESIVAAAVRYASREIRGGINIDGGAELPCGLVVLAMLRE